MTEIVYEVLQWRKERLMLLFSHTPSEIYATSKSRDLPRDGDDLVERKDSLQV